MDKIKKISFIDLLICFPRKLKYDRVDIYSAQASFYLMMSAIPILMIMFTILQYTPLTEEIMVETLSKIINENLMERVQEIIGNVYHGAIKVVSFAAISLFWVSGKAIMGLVLGVNNIHQIREERNWFLLRIRASFYTILLVLALILACSVLVFGFAIQNDLCEHFEVLARYQNLMIYTQTAVSLVLLGIIFMFLYVFLPSKRKTFKSQIPGAVFTTLAWCIFSNMFSLYLELARNMSVIYGGLVTLVVFMLWLYVCMYLFFTGVEINAMMEDPDSFLNYDKPRKGEEPVSYILEYEGNDQPEAGRKEKTGKPDTDRKVKTDKPDTDRKEEADKPDTD